MLVQDRTLQQRAKQVVYGLIIPICNLHVVKGSHLTRILCLTLDHLGVLVHGAVHSLRPV